MTIDEAIKHAEEIASKESEDWIYCIKCREEHKQLAELLKELKTQKTLLDKIRTEIDNINLNEVALKYENRFYGFQQEVIKIIDKYVAESGEIK